MSTAIISAGIRSRQRGALIIVTLLILLIVSVLGMATMDTTGLEMQMASNSRAQQQAFEAAEFTLSWVESSMKTSGYFSDNSLSNTSCGATCFTSTCTNGYCFNGSNPNDRTANACTLSVPNPEKYASEALWANGSGMHRTLTVPGASVTAKYIIEYLCFTPRDDQADYDALANSTRMFRITAYVVGEGGRARVMLRSTIKQI